MFAVAGFTKENGFALGGLEGNAGSIPVARSFTYENSRFLGVES
jgi:hypothetical protein